MSDYSILVCSFVVNKSCCSSYIAFFLCAGTSDAAYTERVQRIQQDVIRKAKRQYKDKIESQYSAGNIRAAWQGIKNMSSINKRVDFSNKPVSLEGVDDQEIPNVLNLFYARFEKHDFSEDLADVKDSLSSDSGNVFDETILSSEIVTDIFKRLNVNKAPGPDGICGRTLRLCAEQLGGVFHHLFQLSLESGRIPQLWKFSNVVPIPKISNPKQPNDFRPVALTSLVMKTVEKIVKRAVLNLTETNLDPLQFAYRAGRGVEDAKLFILNTLYVHLEKPKAHARLLFADFSSAFNTVQPHILAKKNFLILICLICWLDGS
jgi:hypothetical protein